ncbi:unnamed protein product [Amaranthus hypochondriacus]
MVQIEKRKKKGRPSKADLEARRAAQEAEAEAEAEFLLSGDLAEPRDVRRSLRRKSFRYNIIDYDEDYLDNDVVSEEEDDGSEDEDDENGGHRRKRGKKVKLVVKIDNRSSISNSRNIRLNRGGDSVSHRGRRVTRYESEAEEEDEEEEEDGGGGEEEEEEEEEREVKKRRINNGVEENEDDEVENGGNEEEDAVLYFLHFFRFPCHFLS